MNGRIWFNIETSLPAMGQVVWCSRKIPSGKTDYRLSRRMSDKPLTLDDDLARFDFWKGVGPDSGGSWSDGTVIEWAESNFVPVENKQEAFLVLKTFVEENLDRHGENLTWIDARVRDALRVVLKSHFEER